MTAEQTNAILNAIKEAIDDNLESIQEVKPNKRNMRAFSLAIQHGKSGIKVKFSTNQRHTSEYDFEMPEANQEVLGL